MARARGRMGISSAMISLWIQHLGWIRTIQQVWSQRQALLILVTYSTIKNHHIKTKDLHAIFLQANSHYKSSKILLLLLVAHHEDFEFFDIVDQELLESRWQHVFGLFVASITDVGHQHLTLEASAHSVVNTSGLPPVFLQTHTYIRPRLI